MTNANARHIANAVSKVRFMRDLLKVVVGVVIKLRRPTLLTNEIATVEFQSYFDRQLGFYLNIVKPVGLSDYT